MQRARNVQRPSPTMKAVMSGNPPPSCAVIGASELQRYNDIVDQKAKVQAEAHAEQRDDLRKISEKRVSSWPNTIEAQRLRKERARQDRLQKEEERRQLIDQEEEALQQSKKHHAVQKANLLLYEENDRIKNFTAKLFLTTVLEEREQQLAIKEEKKHQLKNDERVFAIKQQEELRKAEEAELTKLKVIKNRTHALKDAQLEQLEDIRQQKIKERDDSRAEGLEIKRGAERAVAEEVETEKQRKLRQHEAAQEFVRANTQQRLLKIELAKKAQEEEDKIAEFARQKEEQMLERKKRVDEKFTLKLKHRQELIDNQGKALQEIKDAVEEREMRAMRDFDKERREREEHEEAYRKRRQREIDNFRQEQLSRKAEEKRRADVTKGRMQGIWRDRAELLIDEELNERQEQRDAAEKLQRFHLLQGQEKHMQSLTEKRAEVEEGIRLQGALKEEQDMYNNYVNSVMTEYVKNGRKADIVKLAASRSKLKSV